MVLDYLAKKKIKKMRIVKKFALLNAYYKALVYIQYQVILHIIEFWCFSRGYV